MPKIISVNISSKKGIAKQPIEKGYFKINHGLVNDAHASPGLKQVSLLAKESIDKFQKSPYVKVCLKNGVFGENLTTEGIELHKLKVGTKLKIGKAILEISKIGKKCLKPCFIAKTVGSCIMPKEGIFAKVIKSGEIKKGDDILIL